MLVGEVASFRGVGGTKEQGDEGQAAGWVILVLTREGIRRRRKGQSIGQRHFLCSCPG